MLGNICNNILLQDKALQNFFPVKITIATSQNFSIQM